MKSASAPGAVTRPPALRRVVALALGVPLVLGVLGLPLHAGPSDARGGVGKPLSLNADGPTMQPVIVPARMARVAVRPGSTSEAWGIGFSSAHRPGWDQITEAGQVVFVRYTAARRWQVQGPPLDAAGKPFNPQLTDLALTPSGDGWAVGAQGMIFRHARGPGAWRLDVAASALTKNQLDDISLGSDVAGVFGYASGVALTFLRFDGHTWSRDTPNGGVPTPAGPIPEMAGVAAASRDVGWAVSGSSSNSLMLFRRSSAGWARVLTGKAIFDSAPAPVSDGQTGTVNQYARGSAIVSDGTSVWASGVMQPVDATKPAGDGGAFDRTRPFVMRADAGGTTFTSYCPPLYQFSSAGVASTVRMCDGAFPFGTGDLPALSAVRGGPVFAGGFGLFRFSRGAWTREPNTDGSIVSASFASSNEGWVASSGDVGGAGVAVSQTMTLGHWTSSAEVSRARRWPQANQRTLESVAADPSGGGAMAVGQEGAIVHIDPSVGVDTMDSPATNGLHAIAWPARNVAWAVGARGTILRYDGARWRVDDASGVVTTRSLYGVAFDGPSRGYAVGARGTILRYDGARWVADAHVTDRNLVAIARARHAFVAVGDKGTIVENDGGGWRARTELNSVLKTGQDAEPPNLLCVAGIGDGTAVIGGARSTVIVRAPDGSLSLDALPPVEGSLLAISAARTSQGVRVLASVGTGKARYNNDYLAAGSGFLMAGDARGWRDVSFSHAGAQSPDVDAPVLRDAVYGLATDGARGWAVGGFPSLVFDDDGHVRTTPTSSVWRVDLDSEPGRSPAETRARIPLERGLTFAFLGDSACATGSCSALLGSGARADEVLLASMQQIASAARDDRVAFVAFGGDMRRNGVPDDLMPVRALFNQMPVPVFAAMGDKDLFAGVGASAAEQQGGVAPSNGYYLSVFRNQTQPWGSGAAAQGFVPVTLGGAAEATRARTHYAFDYAPDGAALARFVFLDTSQVPLASATQSQNPVEEQTSWLQTVLTDASTRKVPSIVFMHQPLVLPVSTTADASVVTSMLTAAGTSAVLASHVRVNEIVLAPSASAPAPVPVGIFGGAGSPLQGGDRPEKGGYHSWQLVSIDTSPGARSVLGQAPVQIRSFPVLESVALHAASRRGAAGRVMRFSGMGRLIDTGGAHGLGRAADQEQGRATYIPFPFPAPCATTLPGAQNTDCRATNVAPPDYHFTSEDPSVADFVRVDPAHPTEPFRDSSGKLVRDDTSGMLCTFRPGSTAIRLESGVVGARIPISVAGGAGPCIPGVFADPPAPATLVPQHARALVPGHVRPPQPNLLRPRVPQQATVGVVAPPIINAAPAPPAGGSGQREEQKEAAGERADFRALPVSSRNGDAALWWFALIPAAALLARAAQPRARHRPAYVFNQRRRKS